MRFILFRLWPAFLPILIYVLWPSYRRRKARASGVELEPFTKGSLFWVLVASILIGIACFLYYGLSMPSNAGGTYIPPHLENGKVIPGQIVPE